MRLSLGFSPCPNDTFIFDALVHKKIDTEGLDFEVYLGDVEDLNQKAFTQTLDITKLSYHAFAYCIDNYILLNSGSALGNNCGPLLIADSRLQIPDFNPLIQHSKFKIQNSDVIVAIPGKYTTANFLLNFAYPEVINKKEMLFSKIENAVLNKEVDAGVIIHENRFTYHDKGLQKLMDLGEYWEQKTRLPIPLGGIVIKKDIDKKTQLKADRILKRSIEYAFTNPDSSKDFVKKHSQEMDKKVIREHINLYVNDYTINLGKKGKEAVIFMLSNIRDINPEEVFVPQT